MKKPPLRRALVALAACALLIGPSPRSAEAACGSGGPRGDVHEAFSGSEFWATIPSGPGPWPLVIALHGDYGSPETDGVLGFWQGLAQQRGNFALLVPRTPSATLSWWKQPDRAANEVWLDSLLAEVQGRYPIDTARIYTWGFSGGACFLGYYAATRQERFAGITFTAGGCHPAALPAVPSSCRIPARLLVGADDFTKANVQDTASFLSAYGSQVELTVLPGVGHIYTAESGGPALDWMASHAPTTCARSSPCIAADGGSPGTTPLPTDGGGSPVGDGGDGGDGGALADDGKGSGHGGGFDGGPASPLENADAGAGSGPRGGGAGGCNVGRSGRSTTSTWSLIVLGFVLFRARKRSMPVPESPRHRGE